MAAGLLFAVAAFAGALAGAAYQPLVTGAVSGHLVGPMVTRQVNDFAVSGQTYLPPQQAAVGAMYVSLLNNGPLPVTIESASLNSPSSQDPVSRQIEPIRDLGGARYWPMRGAAGEGRGARLAATVLQPGQQILIRLPVRIPGCWMRSGSYAVINGFWVSARFLFWSHQTSIWWTDPSDEDSGAILARSPQSATVTGACFH